MHKTKGGLFAGTLFVLPGLIAIMALSWIYVLLGKVTIVQGLFFGLKAAVLVIVVEAVLRVGKRALRNNTMRALAAAAFVALFFFDVPFPIVVVVAGLVGYVGGRAGVPAFLPGGGHGKAGDNQLADANSLLGEETPEHARPNVRWSLSIAAVCLALWLVPVAALYLGLGGDNVFTQIAVFFSKVAVVTFGGAYAVLAYVAQQAVDTYHWVTAGRDAGRAGHGRDHARSADHGDAVRRLPRRLARAGDAAAAAGGDAGRPADDLGHLRALLPLDLLRRALRRGVARQQGAGGGAGGDHGGGGRRDPEPRGLVRAARAVRQADAGAWLGLSRRRAGACSRSTFRRSSWRWPPRVAIFRFKLGMIPVLLASSLAGVVSFLALGCRSQVEPSQQEERHDHRTRRDAMMIGAATVAAAAWP